MPPHLLQDKKMSKNILPTSLFMVSMLYPHTCHGENLYFCKQNNVDSEIAVLCMGSSDFRNDLDNAASNGHSAIMLNVNVCE